MVVDAGKVVWSLAVAQGEKAWLWLVGNLEILTLTHLPPKSVSHLAGSRGTRRTTDCEITYTSK
jgi:hypothetical protein